MMVRELYMTGKNRIVIIFIWILLACLFGFLGIKTLNWSEYCHLAASAVKTTGRVIAKEPENHHFIVYSFDVGARSYSGKGNGGGENPEFEELQIGDPISVYYDPQNPNDSFLGNPREQADSITLGVLFLALVGSTFSIVGLYVKRWLPGSKRPTSRLFSS
jgi:Protein of unknown function (DUF3592)